MNDLEFDRNYTLISNDKLKGNFIETELYKYIKIFILLNPFSNVIFRRFEKNNKKIDNILKVILFLSFFIIVYSVSNFYFKSFLIFVDLFYLMILL